MVTPLSDDELTDALTRLGSWRVEDGHLVRDVTCPGGDTEALVQQVGAAADAMDHHPVVDVSGDRVRFTVWSHSADAITSNDVTLATRIDEIVSERSGT